MKKIYYGRAVYDKKEINAVLNVLKNDSLSLIDGKKVKTLETMEAQIGTSSDSKAFRDRINKVM